MEQTLSAEQARRAAAEMKSTDPQTRKTAAKLLELWQLQQGKNKRKRPLPVPQYS